MQSVYFPTLQHLFIKPITLIVCFMRKYQTGFVQIAKSCFFLIPFLSLSFSLMDQGHVKGKVLDPSGNPLNGASVIVKGTARGTSTDASGAFTINASPGEVLEFSMVGFQVGSVKVGAAGKDISIQLQTKLSTVEEVIVIGYGTQKRA